MPGAPKITLPADLSINDSYHVTLTITEGRNHQVKRMFAALGNRVKSLHRSQIDTLQLDIDQGQWGSLTQQEVSNLYRGTDLSYQYMTVRENQRANSR